MGEGSEEVTAAGGEGGGAQLAPPAPGSGPPRERTRWADVAASVSQCPFVEEAASAAAAPAAKLAAAVPTSAPPPAAASSSAAEQRDAGESDADDPTDGESKTYAPRLSDTAKTALAKLYLPMVHGVWDMPVTKENLTDLLEKGKAAGILGSNYTASGLKTWLHKVRASPTLQGAYGIPG